MRSKVVLTVFLLAMQLSLVSSLGYGEIDQELLFKADVSRMEYLLLDARVDYIMRNPTNFFEVVFVYDPVGGEKLGLPKHANTQNKIRIDIGDKQDVWTHESGEALLDDFRKTLEIIYSYVEHIATDMNIDIVARFYSKGDIALGYFYQGKYHLWNE